MKPSNDTNQKAVLQCRCGACTIALADPVMRARTECFCFDCRQRGLIAASRSPNNALPESVANFKRGVDLGYFSNSLTIDQASRNLIEISKLTPDGANTTAMSSCCGTLMCGTHPLYDGKTISVNMDSCRVTVPTMIAVDAVVFACDAPQEKTAAIKEHSQAPVIFNLADSLESTVMQSFISAVTAPIPAEARPTGATTFEKICSTKQVVINNDFYAESRSQKT